ncbi:DUF5714 domain-containing protein [Carboxydothermus ferrireducens]|uniref:DUF5714 domain-containing protein n=1 Tax=Carboxydothermus ferrireducens DSM 11255 TaxID=1119529 RepID=A0ABX2R656_9THEO|nr:DUF5714 domain-containing protein [Carboxydothermus ferrireducens]NYE56439.1 hypothetical protein [Carboxydothermus ferrireducens DSM 11255]
MAYTEGCLICGAEITYQEEPAEKTCTICGKKELSQAQCSQGHFVCSDCHRGEHLKTIINFCQNTDWQNPVDIFDYLTQVPGFPLHGPEHHALTAASLIAAYQNIIGQKNPRAIRDAVVRAKQLVGGSCGLWGACSAALGAGIAFSIIFGNTPLSRERWGDANRATGKILEKIGAIGGPRCCKRTSYLSLINGAKILEQLTGIKFPLTTPKCMFSRRNKECLKEKCPFYPG